jgi:hypothetical protein
MALKLIADIERYIVPIRTLKSAPPKPRKSNKYNLKPTFITHTINAATKKTPNSFLKLFIKIR